MREGSEKSGRIHHTLFVFAMHTRVAQIKQPFPGACVLFPKKEIPHECPRTKKAKKTFLFSFHSRTRHTMLTQRKDHTRASLVALVLLSLLTSCCCSASALHARGRQRHAAQTTSAGVVRRFFISADKVVCECVCFCETAQPPPTFPSNALLRLFSTSPIMMP